jgi:hypothetical protein
MPVAVDSKKRANLNEGGIWLGFMMAEVYVQPSPSQKNEFSVVYMKLLCRRRQVSLAA